MSIGNIIPKTVVSIASYFKPIIPAMNLMIFGPDMCFADWLAKSKFNEFIKIYKTRFQLLDCDAISQQFSDPAYPLNVKSVKKLDGSIYEEDPENLTPLYYLVDDHIVVSEQRPARRPNFNMKSGDEDWKLKVSASFGRWNPSTHLEEEMADSVKKWGAQQTTYIALIGSVVQIASIIVAVKSDSGLALMIAGCAFGIIFGGMFTSYRAAQIDAILNRSISTTGHWVAEIRRYAYTLHKSYTLVPNVEKYLFHEEVRHIWGYPVNQQGQRLGGPSRIVIRNNDDIDALRRIRHTNYLARHGILN
ncbi:MAG TPA: hypothetical protein VIJ14_03345 [Rhabdochlamydiaceae bacterium]